MKREVEMYLIALLLLGIVFLFAFYQPGFTGTGFAVFKQATQGDFDLGTYNLTVYDANASSVVLDSSTNATSGTYTSQVFDSNNTNATWNNLTFTGQGDLSFEVRVCSSSDCANTSFTSVDLNNLGLTGQYFQYRAVFAEHVNVTTSLQSVSVDYAVPATEPSNSAPVAQDDSFETSVNTAVEITLTASDADDDVLSFSIVSSPTEGQLGNVTIVDNASATVTYTPNEGYVGEDSFTFKASDGTNESNTATISLTISEQSSESEETEEAAEETVPVEPVPEIVPEAQPQSVTQLTASEVQSQTVNPGQPRQASLSVQNTGTEPLTGCHFQSYSDYATWVSSPGEILDLSPGESRDFGFTITAPEETVEGEYPLQVGVECSQTSASRQFTAHVVEITLEFNITGASKIRADEVRVRYVLSDISGEDQTVSLSFVLLNNESQQVSQATSIINLSANETDNFRTDMEINETVEGNLTLQATINSQEYTSSVSEPIVLGGAPLLGFVAFGEFTGPASLSILVIAVLALASVVFVVRHARRRLEKKS